MRIPSSTKPINTLNQILSIVIAKLTVWVNYLLVYLQRHIFQLYILKAKYNFYEGGWNGRPIIS